MSHVAMKSHRDSLREELQEAKELATLRTEELGIAEAQAERLRDQRDSAYADIDSFRALLFEARDERDELRERYEALEGENRRLGRERDSAAKQAQRLRMERDNERARADRLGARRDRLLEELDILRRSRDNTIAELRYEIAMLQNRAS